MRPKSKGYKKFIQFLAKIYVFFKVLRSKPKYLATFLGLIAGVAAIIVAAIAIAHIDNTSDAESTHEVLREDYVVTAEEETTADDRTAEEIAEDDRWSEAVWSMEQDASDELWYGAINVDLDGLQEVNADIVGWLYFEAAEISYPVLYSGDDETYLRATYDGKYATAGSIFLEAQNQRDFSDKHILIYGHNMRDKTMFGQLKLYKTEKNYYSNHQYFQLIYKDSASGKTIKKRYHIFACKDVEDTSDVYQVFASDYSQMDTFAKDVIASGSYISGADVTVDGTDQVVTLSTCSSGEKRFIVSAVECGECVVED